MAKFGAYGELSYGEAIVLDNSFTVAIADKSPSLAGTIKTGVNFSSSVTQSNNVVSSTFKSGHVQTGTVTSSSSTVSASINNASLGSAGVVIESKPTTIGHIACAVVMHGLSIESTPTANGYVIRTVAMRGVAIESQSIISGVISQQPMHGVITESQPFVNSVVSNGKTFSAGITGSNPTLSGSFYNPFPYAFAVALSGSMPVVSAAVKVGHKLTGVITAAQSIVNGYIRVNSYFSVSITDKTPTLNARFGANFQTGSITTIKNPVVLANVIPNNKKHYFQASITDKKPTTLSTTITGKLFSSSVISNHSSVIGNIFNENKCAVKCTESKPVVSVIVESSAVILTNEFAGNVTAPRDSLNAIIKIGFIAYGAISDKRPSIDSEFKSERVMRGVVLEYRPIISSKIISSTNLSGVIFERSPVVKSEMKKGAVCNGNVIDITPILKGIIDNRKGIIVSIIDKKPTLHGWIERRKATGTGNYWL